MLSFAADGLVLWSRLGSEQQSDIPGNAMTSMLPEPFDPNQEPTPQEIAAQERHREIRAKIRAENHVRPRCACCEGDVLVARAYLETLTEDDCEVYYNFFDPGDLLCFWCGCDIDLGRQVYFIWGCA
jgi:hypothetical protein